MFFETIEQYNAQIGELKAQRDELQYRITTLTNEALTLARFKTGDRFTNNFDQKLYEVTSVGCVWSATMKAINFRYGVAPVTKADRPAKIGGDLFFEHYLLQSFTPTLSNGR